MFWKRWCTTHIEKRNSYFLIQYMYFVHTVSAVWLRRRQCMHPVHWLVHLETAPGAQWSTPYQCWYASSPLLKPHEETLSQPTYRNRSFRSQLSCTVWLQQANSSVTVVYTNNSKIVIKSGSLTTSTAFYVDNSRDCHVASSYTDKSRTVV